MFRTAIECRRDVEPIIRLRRPTFLSALLQGCIGALERLLELCGQLLGSFGWRQGPLAGLLPHHAIGVVHHVLMGATFGRGVGFLVAKTSRARAISASLVAGGTQAVLIGRSWNCSTICWPSASFC